MGYIYKRGNKIWLGFKGPDGVEIQKPSGYSVGDEAKAKRKLTRLEAQARAEAAQQPTGRRPALSLHTTVAEYAARWTSRRLSGGVVTATDDIARMRDYILPEVGDLKVNEVRPRHVRDLLHSLKRGNRLAPRTIRHVYGVLHTMFKDAVVDELIDANPCALKRGDLPKIIDKDPTWRVQAVFTRDELLTLISDPRIPQDRRVLYALQGVAGLRFGEAAALRWRCYEPNLDPLGRLLVASSYNTTLKKEKSVKTERPREVPVHATLAALLHTWQCEGFELAFGRAPTPDDLIIPSRTGAFRSRHHAFKKFREDCDRVGLRLRRQHDLRRTFVTLCRTDGARKDVLERISHGPRGDIVDLYTELPWQLLADEVGKLQLILPDISHTLPTLPRTLPTPPTPSPTDPSPKAHQDAASPRAASHLQCDLQSPKKSPKYWILQEKKWWRRRESNPVPAILKNPCGTRFWLENLLFLRG